ncbi:MAG: hypothetical protein HVN35_10205 [Methanobacteriaceae archaeon]|nr:hypothetical protein [Methanobacteriaceae archaeon]
MPLQVKIIDYGFSDSLNRYYVTYHVTGLEEGDLSKLVKQLEDPVVVKGNDIFMNVYFEGNYYPFASEDSKSRLEDYLTREEIEMTAYLLDLLED